MPRPEIDKKKCSMCAVCTTICPIEIFSKDEDKNEIVLKKPEECIGCRACEAQCPNSAIVVKD